MATSQHRPLPAALAACAALALSLVAAPAAADTLVDDIDGLRVDRDGKVTRFEAMLIDDAGRVAALYERGDKRKKDPDYRVDGRGRVLLPGFIDAHVHLTQLGFAALTLDLSETRSLDEALARIREYAVRYPDRRWIVGQGWNQEAWGLGRFPTAAELDAVVSDRAVWLGRVDGHAGWANSLALSEAGVTAATKDPAGGRIERSSDGKPAGVLVDAAAALVQAKVPPPLPEERDLALTRAQDLLLSRGITAVHDMGTTLADWQALRRSGDYGRLSLRVVSYASGIEDMVTIAGPGPSPWLYGDRLRLAGVKLYLDGALGSRGAWLKQPYADAPGQTGLPTMNGTQLRNLMSRAAMDEFQVAVHAIGDAANAEAIMAVAELNESFEGDRRWRIEHAQIVEPADIALFAATGAIASMQPLHQASDRTMAEARLGIDNLAGAYAWKSLETAGVPLAFGSDAPVEKPDVLAGMAVAISRQDASGQPFGGWTPGERIDRQSALAAYTAGAAYAGGSDKRYGSLAVGEWADFVFLTGDPLIASPEELRTMRVLETWIAGRKAWEARSSVPSGERR